MNATCLNKTFRFGMMLALTLVFYAGAQTLAPLPENECQALQDALEAKLERPLERETAALTDGPYGLEGESCRLTATGTGEDFGAHFSQLAQLIADTLQELGWQEDMRYAADGPTATASGFHLADALALAYVAWEPAEGVDCPDDQPIFLCEVPPERQILTVQLDVGEERENGARGNGARENRVDTVNNEAARRAVAALAEQLGAATEAIEVVAVEAVDWPDSCLGLAGPEEMCLQAITPGYRITLRAGGQTYVYHSDRSGNALRRAETVRLEPLPLERGTVRNGEDGEAAITRLALRLLTPWAEMEGMQTELLAGRLPDDLALDIPLPLGSALLGSMARRQGSGELYNLQVVLDAPMSTEEAMAFLQEGLQEAGWRGQRDSYPRGFVPVQANLSGMFCAPDDSTFMYVNILFRRGRPADVRLDVNLEAEYSPCPQLTDGPFEGYEVPLPMLAAPEGAEIFVFDGIMSPDVATSSASLVTGLGRGEVLAHYEAQLLEAGWERAGEEAGATLSQSRWTITRAEREWTGLIILSDISENRYYASMVVTAEVTEPPAAH